MASLRGVSRGGMQVHAVPESERAYDSAGRQLPWGYEYADSELNARRIPEEKGPFGKSMRRRGTSRSKTYTPARKEDQAKSDNTKVIDDIFGSYKASLKTEEAGAAAAAALKAEAGPVKYATSSAAKEPQEPTEVVIYGFGVDFQWAAIEFFERVSGGMIYEDYEREPPHQRFNQSLSLSRSRASQSLSQAALRKKNQYVGGDHWIKVTFDSPQAADLACRASPHNLNGCAVSAELYRGVGPREDVAVKATYENMNNDSNSPQTVRSATLPLEPEQPAIRPPALSAASNHFTTLPPDHPLRQSLAAPQPTEPQAVAGATAPNATATALARPKTGTLRIRGARSAVLKPAEEALLPVVPRWQQNVAGIPIIGSIVGGTSLIGNEVPRKEDGTFDWNTASTYWWFWGCLDHYFGTDFCGLRPDDE